MHVPRTSHARPTFYTCAIASPGGRPRFTAHDPRRVPRTEGACFVGRQGTHSSNAMPATKRRVSSTRPADASPKRQRTRGIQAGPVCKIGPLPRTHPSRPDPAPAGSMQCMLSADANMHVPRAHAPGLACSVWADACRRKAPWLVFACRPRRQRKCPQCNGFDRTSQQAEHPSPRRRGPGLRGGHVWPARPTARTHACMHVRGCGASASAFGRIPLGRRACVPAQMVCKA